MNNATGTIGVTALYLLFSWLISAAAAAWLADRKGYGERLGLTFGLILSVVGLLIVLVLPGRPGSAWRVDGWLPKRHAKRLSRGRGSQRSAPLAVISRSAPGSLTGPWSLTEPGH